MSDSQQKKVCLKKTKCPNVFISPALHLLELHVLPQGLSASWMNECTLLNSLELFRIDYCGGCNEEANNLGADLYIMENDKHLLVANNHLHSGRKVTKVIMKCITSFPRSLKFQICM